MASTASMQWLIQKKKMQSFFLQRQAVFCEFRTTSDAQPPWATTCLVMQLLFTPCDILDVTRPQKQNSDSVWPLWAHVNCTLTISLDNVYLLVDDSTFASTNNKYLEDSRAKRRDLQWSVAPALHAVDLRFCWSVPRSGAGSGWSLLLFCQKANEERTEEKTARLLHPSQVAYIWGQSSVRGTRRTVDAHASKNVSRSCNRGAARAFWKSSCQAGKIWRQICEDTAFLWHPDFSLSDPEGNFWHTYRCSTRVQRRFLSIKVFGGAFVRSVF